LSSSHRRVSNHPPCGFEQFKPREIVATSVTAESAKETLQRVYTAVRADMEVVTPSGSKAGSKRRSCGEYSRDCDEEADAWSLGPSSDGEDCETEVEADVREEPLAHLGPMPPVLYEPVLTRADHFRTVRKSKLTTGRIPRGQFECCASANVCGGYRFLVPVGSSIAAVPSFRLRKGRPRLEFDGSNDQPLNVATPSTATGSSEVVEVSDDDVTPSMPTSRARPKSISKLARLLDDWSKS
jgi:hypothetical protein